MDIGVILDEYLPALKGSKLIFFFTALDIGLWLMTKNFFKALDLAHPTVASHRQISLIGAGQKTFFKSVVVDVAIIAISGIFFTLFISDPQSKLALELLLLQAFYMVINLLVIVNDFKYK
jgi:hypothetical protein